jgi:tRNA (guanine37-N1)-methyltransferase
MQAGLDQIGDIGIINFHKNYFFLRKWFHARSILKQNKNLNTILEKRGQIKGNLRTFKTRHLAGKKEKTTTHKENNCLFYLDVEKTYFSPRLSNERKLISEEVLKKTKNNSKILVMFAGIAPYPITIAKKIKQKKLKATVFSNELNKEANKFAEINRRLNKLEKQIEFINGDAKEIPNKTKNKFDIILMPRPNINDTFLKTALTLSKKGTTIYYHGFGTKEEVLNEIENNTKNKIGKISIRKAGDIAPFKYRWQATFKVR